MDHRTSDLRRRVGLASAFGLAAVIAGCNGGETGNAAPESALASPRSEIKANPSGAAPTPTKDLEKPAASTPSEKAEPPRKDEGKKDEGRPDSSRS